MLQCILIQCLYLNQALKGCIHPTPLSDGGSKTPYSYLSAADKDTLINMCILIIQWLWNVKVGTCNANPRE